MVPNQGNSPARDDDRSAAQPPPLPKNFWKTFLKRLAVSARILGKEIYRNRLRWLDLRGADYRLGKKAYENQASLPNQNRTIDRLKRIQDRIETLTQPASSGPFFKEKARGAVKGVGTVMKIQILKFRRNRLFRKLGSQIRQSQSVDASLVTEIEFSKAVSDRIQSVNANIKELAAGTYFWARRPLPTVSIALAVTILCAGVVYEQEIAVPDSSTPKKAAIAFIRALQSNQMKMAHSLAIGSDKQLADWKLESDLDMAITRSAVATAKTFSDQSSSATDRNWNTQFESAIEKIDGDNADLSDGKRLLMHLRRTGGKWMVDLAGAGVAEDGGSDRVLYGLKFGFLHASAARITAINDVTTNIEQGRYKTKKEALDDGRAKLDAATAPQEQRTATTDQPSPVDRVTKTIETSASAKMECPKCGGHGKIVRLQFGDSWATYEYRIGEEPSYHEVELLRPRFSYPKCDRCDGTGVVNK